MSAFFIVLDGPDGSGTTTQSELLATKLRADGLDVVVTAEPTNGEIGKGIRHWLKTGSLPADALQLVFTADRADHVSKVIQPALKAGKVVICDRYIPSTLVYGAIQGVPMSWLQAANAQFPTPDILFLALPPLEVCMKRLQKREQKDFFETEGIQARLHDVYRTYATTKPDAIVIDTSGEKEATTKALYDAVKAKLL